MTQNMREQVIKDLDELCNKEIEKSKILIDFYSQRAEKIVDKEKKGAELLKAEQIKDALSFNTDLYDYIKSL